MIPESKKICVTGGTGKIGRPLVDELQKRGYAVRVVTSKNRPPRDGIEWRQMDYLETLAFDDVVEGCDAVIHLAAELSSVGRMQRVNVEATRALVTAVERSDVKFFCYTSSMSVYGSPRTPDVTEDSAVVATRNSDDYRAEPYMRNYALTKLMGEQVIAEEASKCGYVVFRPTRVCSLDDFFAVGDWSLTRKILCGYRHAHHIYEQDVADAMIWFMERALNGSPRPGIEIFNLSNDEDETNYFANFMKKAFRYTNDKRFYSPVTMPPAIDIAKDLVKYRHISFRYPSGMFRVSPRKLYGTGYRFPFGIAATQDLAIRKLMETLTKTTS